MATLDQQPTPSKAAIAGHPLHPLLVPLPIGFLVVTLASDLANRVTQDPFWSQASYWLAIAGVVTGVVAALAGFVLLTLLVTGLLGGEMVFRNRVGVMGPVSEPASARPHADPEGIRAARR